jgi:predicted DNA-binding ribbon-helix-helix protein
MWNGLTEVCRRERANIHEVCTSVAMYKADNTSLTAAIRVLVMAYFRAAATEEGHVKAAHGYGILMGVPAAPVARPAQPNMSVAVSSPPPVSSPPSQSMQRPHPVSPFVIGASRMTKDGMR